MTLAEFKTKLETIQGFNGKVAYRAFPIGEAPDLPFICFIYTGDDNFLADDVIFYAKKQVIVELYSRQKDEASEAAVEAVLAGFIYTKEESWIEDERMTLITYTMEV